MTWETTGKKHWHLIRATDTGFFHMWGGAASPEEIATGQVLIADDEWSVCSQLRDQLNAVRSYLGMDMNEKDIEDIKNLINNPSKFSEILDRIEYKGPR